jgi:cation transport ATPase
VRAGSQALPDHANNDGELAWIRASIADLERAGPTAVAVVANGALQECSRSGRAPPSAAERNGLALTAVTGHRPRLMTGDNAAAASNSATKSGVTDVRAGLRMDS